MKRSVFTILLGSICLSGCSEPFKSFEELTQYDTVSGVAELRYKMLYGKCEINSIAGLV